MRRPSPSLQVIEALLPVRVQPGDDLARLHSQSSDVALGTSYDVRRHSSAERLSRSQSADLRSADHSAGHTHGQGHGPFEGAGPAYAHDSPADAHTHATSCCDGGCKPERCRQAAEPVTGATEVVQAAARPLLNSPRPQPRQLPAAADRPSHPALERPSQHHIEAATEQWVVAWRVWVRDAALLSVVSCACARLGWGG